jgi:hypothetical protein
VSDRTDLIACLASFDRGFAFDTGPCVVIERADNRPYFLG